MFSVLSKQLIDSDLPLIVNDERVLLSEDGLPILFIGSNRFGSRIIGSSVDEDYKKGFERYFHTIINDEEYVQYFSRKITLRELYEAARPLYVIDKYKSETKVYHTSFNTLPDEYKPSPKTYCPNSALTPSSVYEVPLGGGLAINHRALPDDVEGTSHKLVQFMNLAFGVPHQYFEGLMPVVYSRPARVSSYGMTFEILFEGFTDLFVSQENCWEYINNFISYCLEDLPSEAHLLSEATSGEAERFSALIEKAFSLVSKHGTHKELKDEVASSLLTDVLETPPLLNALAKTVNSNYRYLRISNNDVPLGTIDSEFAGEIGSVVQRLEDIKKARTAEDNQTERYRLHVYSFNKNNGTGWAYLEQPDETVTSVRIAFSHYDAPLHAGKFTGSEHLGQYISVNGRLTRTDGKPVKITVDE